MGYRVADVIPLMATPRGGLKKRGPPGEVAREPLQAFAWWL